MIRLTNVKKSFNRHKSNEIRAIDNTSIELGDTGLVTFLGNSGCGKTTLLNAIGGLDKVDSGDIYIDGERLTRRTSGRRDVMRNARIGYIFQNYNLIEDATVFENVALPLRMTGFTNKAAIERRVMYILKRVGIDRYRNRPAKMLSGGERQRVGIARAIVKNPSIIIADEPTGNLDSANTIEVMNIIKAVSKEKLVILVTHERDIAEFYADRIVEIVDGRVVSDRANEHEGNLDYRLDTKIYLKDMPVHEDLSREGFDIQLYSDRKELPAGIRIVVRGGNIYIDTGDTLDMGAEGLEMVDGHYEGLSKDVYEKYEFNYQDFYANAEAREGASTRGVPKAPRYRRIYGVGNSILGGFRKIRRYSVIKKILLVGFILASMFVVYAASNVAGVLHITDDKFTTMDKDYVTVKVGQLTEGKLKELSSMEGLDYAIPGPAIVHFAIPLDDYIQSAGMVNVISGSLSDKDKVSEEDLLCGHLPENKYELVVDKMIIDMMTEYDRSFAQIGIADYEDFVGRTLKTNLLPDFTIAGISNRMEPCIYADRSMFQLLVMNDAGEDASSIVRPPYVPQPDQLCDASLYEDKPYLSVVRGEWPDEDGEVLVPESLLYEVGLGGQINIKVGGEYLVVSGFYHDMRGGEGLYVTRSTLFRSMIGNFDQVTLSPVDRESFVAGIDPQSMEVIDNYATQKEMYTTQMQAGVTRTIAIAVVIVLISLIEIYLILRASFLSRIKEVGVLRAIGLKKSDIYRMFAGEVFAITMLTTLPGVIGMGYVMYNVAQVGYLSSMYRVTWWLLAGCFCVLFLFNMLAGLLPVFRTMRKTPAAILARNDVN